MSLADPETALGEAYRLLERAEEMITRREGSDTDQNRQKIAHARRLLERAEREIAGGRTNDAIRLIAQARRLLREAVRMEPGSSTAEQAMITIERVEALREDAAAIMEGCAAPGVETLYSRAAEHLERAKDHLAGGNPDTAAAEARIARNMFNRIREICSNL
jgi:hypothetical protein